MTDTDPWTVPDAATCEGCGTSALKAMPPEVAPPAGGQYLCVDCVMEGIVPDITKFSTVQLRNLIGYLTSDDRNTEYADDDHPMGLDKRGYDQRVLTAARADLLARTTDPLTEVERGPVEKQARHQAWDGPGHAIPGEPEGTTLDDIAYDARAHRAGGLRHDITEWLMDCLDAADAPQDRAGIRVELLRRVQVAAAETGAISPPADLLRFIVAFRAATR